jgi:hypothetical protein
LLGTDASETNLKNNQLEKFQIVNFATHGVLAGDIDSLDEPALTPSIPDNPTKNNDRLQKSSEIASLRFESELVILSACNTAGSDGRPGAEGLSGLANAFFYAGARNLPETCQKPDCNALGNSLQSRRRNCRWRRTGTLGANCLRLGKSLTTISGSPDGRQRTGSLCPPRRLGRPYGCRRKPQAIIGVIYKI